MLSCQIQAQDTIYTTDNPFFQKPDIDAEYHGGLEALNKYFSHQFRISEDYIWQNTKTARIIIDFTVEENGNLTDVYTVRHSLFLGNNILFLNQMTSEIEGIIKRTSGDWRPAVRNNTFVRQKHRMVVQLNNASINDGLDGEEIHPIWAIPHMDAPKSDHVYTPFTVEYVPYFLPGEDILNAYLNDSLPSRAGADIPGFVDVEFLIKENGEIEEFKILKKHRVPPKHLHLARELVSDMNNLWQPASILGQKVSCRTRLRLFYGATKKPKGSAPLNEKKFEGITSNTPFATQKASYRGTTADFNAFIRQNLMYTPEALMNCTSGWLNVTCTVGLNGNISEVHIGPNDSIGSGMDEQVKQVLLMKNYKWVPAYLSNSFVLSNVTVRVPVRVIYTNDEKQNPPRTEKLYEEFEVTEKASFKQGMDSFYNLFLKEFHYPQLATLHNEGGRVSAEVWIEKDGFLSHAKILNQKEKQYCVEEELILFMARTNGQWEPAKIKGYPVRSRLMIPLQFRFR